MERNVAEAVINNIGGTQNVIDSVLATGCQHLVLISTDKAVHPANVMGATKRVAEQLVQRAAVNHGRNFISVRFGNVLGSRGSVVPIFLRQIEAGGPVTVTHPEMRRYFMTIPESVQLVLQAVVLGQGGEVFVLDMGEPIKIVDLASDLIRLSGLEVGRDIEIEFTGARAGEKLFEELFFGAEVAVPTEHSKVLRAKHLTPPTDLVEIADQVVQLAQEAGDPETIRGLLQLLVPDYQPESGRRWARSGTPS
jgi:FlaA1/EpsC-like NDP-sugar epimerase